LVELPLVVVALYTESIAVLLREQCKPNQGHKLAYKRCKVKYITVHCILFFMCMPLSAITWPKVHWSLLQRQGMSLA